jgi:high affinity Mn2+ porin
MLQPQLLAAALWLSAATLASAQTPNPQPSIAATAQPQDQPQTTAPQLTVFPHSDRARYLLSGQANIIFQAHPGFHSPYEGTNSLLSRGEYKTSLIGTLYLGYQLIANPRYNLDALYDEESAGGRGISEALGLAGFTNLDVVRNPSLGPVPYMARVQLHQTIGLTSRLADADRNQFSLATQVPERRIDLRAGKMSLPDVLDLNDPGSDSHLQFLNWTVDNNGAWDYAADTRGYTYAFVTEYDDKQWSARYALALMPTIANGVDLQWNLRRASGNNFEAQWNNGPLSALLSECGIKAPGVIRVLSFINTANMGVYRTQNNLALYARAHGSPSATPDITAHPAQVTTKYGFGLNFQQDLTSGLRLFGRFGWGNGRTESYAYTEVDQTFELGADLKGDAWSRPSDKLGLVAVSNAIKRDHQDYLKLGGLGFLLGDGNLSYAREDILEAYYTAHNWRGLFTSFDTQLIAHPGYNQSRGPVAVFSVRTHVDF